jgi:hypothetical protein
MADKSTLEEMLEHLVNENTEKAEELFHEYVVAKSRDIYENLIQEEMEDEEVDEASEKDEDESVDEASKDDDAEEDKVDESSDDEEVEESSKDEEVDEEFEEVAIEGDDEDEMDAMGGDETDDLEADVTGDDEGEKEPEELFQDLDSIVDELQAKFDEIKGGDEEGADDMDMGDEEDKEEEMFAPEATEKDELETMREYVEKVAGGHGAEKKGAAEGADNKKSVVDNMKNDMGGTTANIAKGGEGSEKNDGGLADINAKEDNAGNVNVPGAKNATKMSNEKGHGAEKKGAAENADNKQSIFRGRR